jgi:DNA-3-methyladenine glycosylase
MGFLQADFFQRDFLTVARELVGLELVWHGCSGIIVETEGYAVEGDAACHTATRKGARQFVREKPAGAAYVYLNYGTYWLFNLHVKGGGRDGLILIRAMEPRRGIAQMRLRRGARADADLCSGPGKLGLALGISGEHHGSIVAGPGRLRGCGLRKLSAARSGLEPGAVVADVRVGIRLATDLKWRFLLKNSPAVSVPAGKVKQPR